MLVQPEPRAAQSTKATRERSGDCRSFILRVTDPARDCQLRGFGIGLELDERAAAWEEGLLRGRALDGNGSDSSQAGNAPLAQEVEERDRPQLHRRDLVDSSFAWRRSSFARPLARRRGRSSTTSGFSGCCTSPHGAGSDDSICSRSIHGWMCQWSSRRGT